MLSPMKRIAVLGMLLGSSAAAQAARADEAPCSAGQTTSDAGAGDSAKPVCSGGGDGHMPDAVPTDGQLAAIDTGPANPGAAAHPNAGSDERERVAPISQSTKVGGPAKKDTTPAHMADLALAGRRSQQDQAPPVVFAAAPRPSSRRLPIFGVMADVGLPDGLIGALTIRPWNWVRLSAGGGTNFISGGWRAGITLLPFTAGPSASFEYGRYQDGDANAMAGRFGFGGSPVLERVGYQYMNAHLGLDFGFRRCVFFIHGGVTVLNGQIHNLNAAISAPNPNSSNGTTEVVVRQDPSAKAVGPSLKLGLIVYIR